MNLRFWPKDELFTRVVPLAILALQDLTRCHWIQARMAIFIASNVPTFILEVIMAVLTQQWMSRVSSIDSVEVIKLARKQTLDFWSFRSVENDDERCTGCSGKVYDLERIVSPKKRLVFHKDCFNCAFCKKKLDGHNSHTSQVWKGSIVYSEYSKITCRPKIGLPFWSNHGKSVDFGLL